MRIAAQTLLIITVVTLSSLPSRAATEKGEYYSYNTISCAEYAHSRQSPSDEGWHGGIVLFIQGWLTAFNQASPAGGTKHWNMKRVLERIDKYCEAHPSEGLNEALPVLTYDIHETPEGVQ